MGKVKPHQKLPTKWDEREALRDKGQFWTPAWVAEAMVSYVAQDADLVFDPATGRGAFCEALIGLNKPDVSFLGIDIDAEVIQAAVYGDARCYVEKRDFLKNPPERKFSAIVGNPPYIRHHRIDEKTKRFLKQLTANITGFTIDGRAGYHVYFLLQALSHLEKGGKLAFILPADVCEGKFAKTLWGWIAENFYIEAAVAFDEEATPFPNVDTNALVFFIKNAGPSQSFQWVKATQAHSPDLAKFVASGFQQHNFSTLEITCRQLKEGLETGFSRPQQNGNGSAYTLADFATVMRGIATGANEFFFLTAERIKALNIPGHFFKRAIGRTRDATGGSVTNEDVNNLEHQNRPTHLLSINGHDELPKSVLSYLRTGEEIGLPQRPLIQQRKPWYKMEKREVPPLLFAYLGRRNIRFIKNEACVLPLTGFLCVYPLYPDAEYTDNLWKALNHPDTLENLKLVGKSYGSGALKVEPGNLSKLSIPEHIVNQFNLKRPYKTAAGQLEIFREPEKEYENETSQGAR